jgi:hypothetical protein
MIRWFKQNVMFVSVSSFGAYLYIHFIPRRTIQVGVAWWPKVFSPTQTQINEAQERAVR